MSDDQNKIKEVIRQEYIKCAKDPIHFMKKYCYIAHPQRGRILFHLYPFQEKVLGTFLQNNYNVINKSRQLGISTLVAGYALWMMLFNKDKTILCIATRQSTAANMVEKVQFMYDSLPSWIKGNKPPTNNKLSLKLTNGSQIIATSASGHAARSYAVSLLIIDEAAFIEDIEKVYTAAKPTIAAGGGCIALSSPNGMGNWFHRMWTKAEMGEGDFVPVLLPWQVHPERDDAWFKKESTNMTPREIAQEYECDFLGSGNSVIDDVYLSEFEKKIKEPKEKRYHGDFWIWVEPDYTMQYIVASDVARGDGADFSTAHVICIETTEVVAEFRTKLPTRDFAHKLMAIATEYNNALLSVENAGIGWDVVNEILSNEYKNFYHSPKSMTGDFSPDAYVRKLENNQTVPGFTLGSSLRPLVISKMESYIRDRVLTFYSRRLLEELRTFIWINGKPQAMNGYNDDLVMALCQGLYLRDTASKFFKTNLEQSKAALNAVYKSTGTAANYNPQNPLHRPTQNGGFEDMSWVLR
jgi:hypothetical protein